MKLTKTLKTKLPFTVLRDDREKKGHGWEFPPTTLDDHPFCGGTEIAHLETGDYTIAGLESRLAIERKGAIAEFVGSLVDPNFEAELARMRLIPVSVVILEFGMYDIVHWPESSKLSPKIRSKLPLRHKDAALSRLTELIVKYPYVNFLFTDFWGQEVAMGLFKRVLEMNPPAPLPPSLLLSV